jgi:hypothetical protein
VEHGRTAAQPLDFVVLTVPFTRERSKVRSLVRPPFVSVVILAISPCGPHFPYWHAHANRTHQLVQGFRRILKVGRVERGVEFRHPRTLNHYSALISFRTFASIFAVLV